MPEILVTALLAPSAGTIVTNRGSTNGKGKYALYEATGLAY